MLMPRRVKHRKQHHPNRSGAAKGGTKLAFGEFGIQAIEGHYVTNRQIESWVANVKPGRVLFELSGVDDTVAREAMRRAMHKLPMKCRFITREAGEF
jgi:large subunit ribosomal protein L16